MRTDKKSAATRPGWHLALWLAALAVPAALVALLTAGVVGLPVQLSAAESGGPRAAGAPTAGSTAPQLHVWRNRLVNALGQRVVLHGVDRSGGEYACVQGFGVWDGPMNQAAVSAMKTWRVNAVRVPLNEACWNA